MPEDNPNKTFIDARTSLRDTAKWIVAILGATVVLVIGGGLIARVADLELAPRLIAATCLLVLTFLCLVPLRLAINIVASRLSTFRQIAVGDEYAATRAIVDGWLAGHYPPEIGTVDRLYQMYVDTTTIVNDQNRAKQERDKANQLLGELQPRIREILEICNTESLRLRFDNLVRRTTWILPLIGMALFVFLVASHKDEGMEKTLMKPVLMQVAWSADIEDILTKAGLDEKCFAKTRPRFLQLSEKSGLRAGVLIVPQDLGSDCPAVRVIVTSASKVYAAD